MPIYGENKLRNMSRSVLPSTKRRTARSYKRQVHSSARARVKNALRNWDEECDDSDLFIDPQHGPVSGAYFTMNIKDVVYERRNGDKLGPIMRWAEAKADEFGDTPAERYKKLRSLLPENIIGWHAMTHIDFLPEYEIDPRRYRFSDYYNMTKAERKAENDARWAKEAVEVAEVIKLPGMHKAFNNLVKSINPSGHTRTKIIGWKPKEPGTYFAERVTEEEFYTCDRCRPDRIMLKGWSHVEAWLGEVRYTCRSSAYLAAFENFHKEYC